MTARKPLYDYATEVFHAARMPPPQRPKLNRLLRRLVREACIRAIEEARETPDQRGAIADRIARSLVP